MTGNARVCSPARDDQERDVSLNRLPKSVRFIGKGPAVARCEPRSSNPMCEFEVLTGNASYREGEHFYLTPAQAKRAYFLDY